uniref:Minor capsid protein L2 n=1 Tax=Human papillomavirus type 2 TaxID=333751 RepID=A3F910_9PAPI|nr:late protein L2 [Human papillomavirus type 2]
MSVGDSYPNRLFIVDVLCPFVKPHLTPPLFYIVLIHFHFDTFVFFLYLLRFNKRAIMSIRAKRRKRASPTDLYRTCKQAGTCPPDIIPRVEQNTLADKILKWGSLGVFFGGLGIGTGSGTGGRTGYIPVGSRPTTVVDIGPTPRPPVVIEPVGASEPSIVTLVEDSSIINAGASHPTFTGTGGFEVTTSTVTDPAVLDITPSGTSVQVSSSSFLNPLYTEPAIVEAPQTGEVSGHVLVSTATSGSHGYEEIPMQTFATSGGSGTEPISSTPLPGVRRVAGPRLYSRANQQVQVRDPAFLARPADLVTFDNPVYDPEETIIFQHPDLHEPPDPDFLDIVALHRPALTSRRGTVRFSRLGRRATLRTRSGKQIGARVHFYHDISPIGTEELEMEPLLPPASTDNTDMLYDVYADSDVLQPLLDELPAAPRGSLSLADTAVSATSASTLRGSTTVPLSSGIDVPVYTGPDIEPPNVPGMGPLIPVAPSLPSSVYIFGGDYYLMPSYVLWPKRRKRVHYFFADGFVAA